MAEERGRTVKPWAGRFREGQSKAVETFTESVSFDHRLYRQDIAGSKAHATMLAARGIISEEDVRSIITGLDQVLGEIESGVFQWRHDLEDVHMNIESRLTELVGDAGRKLHTGRSRNDQVALDFRLYVAERLRAWQSGCAALVAALVDQASAHREVLLPGCTHLQPAQPVSLAQHLLAYAWMLVRDVERMTDCLKRTQVSPLGAAALAGTTHDLDPWATARELGLDRVFDNSMDAVSDRDFVAEALFCASLCMVHLSRFCEELILWANPNFGYLSLPDAYSTGSSIMPQKKNPDVAELVRGKVGRVHGALVALLTTLKGLPLAYNRDMQEDKEPFFETDRTLDASLSLMAGMTAALRFRPERMRQALKSGFVNATELADYLVRKGVPFRDAHHATGRAVALAEENGRGLEDLDIEELRGCAPEVENDVYEALAFETAVCRRNTHGGTGPVPVAKQLEDLRRWLENCAPEAGRYE